MKGGIGLMLHIPKGSPWFCGLGFIWAWVALAFFSEERYAGLGDAGFDTVWGLGTLAHAAFLLVAAGLLHQIGRAHV